MFTSAQLTEGHIYTRADLRQLFHITAATLNNGIFRPAGHNSVWLFVTEQKPSSSTQYNDRLDGRELHWEGQMAGRSDNLIIDHARSGLELLLFYRKTVLQYPGSGFRYEGRFRYASHTGAHPTRFTLTRVTS